MSTEQIEDAGGLLFNLRSTDSLDLFARMCAMLQVHQVDFEVTKDGDWVRVVIEGGAQ